MVALTEVERSNKQLSSSHKSITAVFVGATAGIGLATLKSFARHIPEPKALIIGRNKAAFAPHLKELEQLNGKGDFQYFEASVSLLKNIDAVSSEVKQSLGDRKIDLLFQSQGYIGFNGREENADGLDNANSLRYYGRMRFIDQLLPALSSNARVVSVLAGGMEGKINTNDLELKKPGNYSIISAAFHACTMNTLAMEKLAEDHPGIGFLHYHPGVVNTDLLSNSATGILRTLFKWVILPILSWFAMSVYEAGERGLYYSTIKKYGAGIHILNQKGEPSANETVLVPYRQDGTREKVWEHTQAVFRQVLED